MASLVSSCNRAKKLGVQPPLSPGRHCPVIGIARLLGETRPVYRTPIQSWRCTGLETRHRQISGTQLLRKPMRRSLSNPTALKPFFTAKQRSTKERARTKHDRARTDPAAVSQDQTCNTFTLEDQFGGFSFDHDQIRLALQHSLDGAQKKLPICLYSRPPNRASLGSVEHAIVNRRGIRRLRNQSAKRVHLADEMSFTQSSNSRIATHCPDSGKVETDEAGTRTHACGNCRSFAARMATTYYKDIEASHRRADRALPSLGQRGECST